MDWKKDIREQKVQFVLALAVTAMLAAVLCTLAWLSYSRSLLTATSVNMPSLWLNGKKGEAATSIALDNIDVVGTDSKECVFSVVSTTDTPYMIQLAYTQNIQFEYTVYPATYSVDENGDASYARQTALIWTKLPRERTKAEVYAAEDTVHVAANPQYLQTQPIDPKDPPTTFSDNGRFHVQYYILEITWDLNARPENNKETDMVYLSAGTVN